MNVKDWCEIESLSTITANVHHGPNADANSFSTEPQFLHYNFYVNWSYAKGRDKMVLREATVTSKLEKK